MPLTRDSREHAAWGHGTCVTAASPVRVLECQAGWPICTLLDRMEWRRARRVPARLPFSSALEAASPNPLG